MNLISDLTGILDKRSKTPTIHVKCSIMVYTEKTTVKLVPNSNGFNPTIFLVDAIVDEKEGPMKGQPRTVEDTFEVDHKNQFKQVQVVCGDQSATADLKVIEPGGPASV